MMVNLTMFVARIDVFYHDEECRGRLILLLFVVILKMAVALSFVLNTAD